MMTTGPRPKKKPFVFVVMPFSKTFDALYEQGIKKACAQAGATCARVDKQIFLENILQQIYGQIKAADVIVSEMSGRKENVFYETGYAHGLGKRVILLTSDAKDIPFDLKHSPHLVHGGDAESLRKQLKRTLRWCFEHPEEGPTPGPSDKDALAREDQRMSQHIINYLDNIGRKMVSFDRIRERINPNYTDERLEALIERSPEKFRRALLKDRKWGIHHLA